MQARFDHIFKKSNYNMIRAIDYQEILVYLGTIAAGYFAKNFNNIFRLVAPPRSATALVKPK